jgi:hypothetical protein
MQEEEKKQQGAGTELDIPATQLKATCGRRLHRQAHPGTRPKVRWDISSYKWAPRLIDDAFTRPTRISYPDGIHSRTSPRIQRVYHFVRVQYRYALADTKR